MSTRSFAETIEQLRLGAARLDGRPPPEPVDLAKSLRSMGTEAIEKDGRVIFNPLPPPWRRGPTTRKPKKRV